MGFETLDLLDRPRVAAFCLVFPQPHVSRGICRDLLGLYRPAKKGLDGLKPLVGCALLFSKLIA